MSLAADIGKLRTVQATQVSDCLSAQVDLVHQAALILRPEKHVHDPIRMLRALLRIAGRQFGLKAIQIREQRDDIAAIRTQSMSLLGVKRTCPFALHMSAFDPKRTSSLFNPNFPENK
jgi:hypothetical protein